jgi:hypothetical protein
MDAYLRYFVYLVTLWWSGEYRHLHVTMLTNLVGNLKPLFEFPKNNPLHNKWLETFEKFYSNL